MLKRYVEIRDFLPKVKIDAVTKVLLSLAVIGMVDKVCLCFREIDTITKALQSENSTLSDVRAYFDEVIGIHPEFHERLGLAAYSVLRPHFESGIVKLQQGRPHELLATELEAVAKLKVTIPSNSEVDLSTLSLAEKALKKRRINRETDENYLDTNFILPKSNVWERLFSIVGHAVPDRRKLALPNNIEMQVFLHMNSDLWSISNISAIVNET